MSESNSWDPRSPESIVMQNRWNPNYTRLTWVKHLGRRRDGLSDFVTRNFAIAWRGLSIYDKIPSRLAVPGRNKSKSTAQHSGSQHDRSCNELGVRRPRVPCLHIFASLTKSHRSGALYDSARSAEVHAIAP